MGSIFAISLFVLQETMREKVKKNDLSKNLLYELQYNKKILEKFDKRFDTILRYLMAEEQNIFLEIIYTDIKFYFLTKYYDSGYLITNINSEEFQEVLSMTGRYNAKWEIIIRDYLKKWRESEIEKQKILRVLEFEKRSVEKSKKIIEILIKKLEEP